MNEIHEALVEIRRQRKSSADDSVSCMVPLNSRAFFKGRITFNGQHADACSEEDSAILPQHNIYLKEGTDCEEEIYLKSKSICGYGKQDDDGIGDNFCVAMSLDDAIARCMEASKPAVKATMNEIRNVNVNSKKFDGNTKTRSGYERKQDEESAGMDLPCFEIREEFDSQGNQILGEAIDVQARIDILLKKEGSRKESTTSIRKRANISGLENSNSSDGLDTFEKHEYQATLDEEYEKISSRLDELIMLEEEELEKEERINIRRRKQKSLARKGGWKKGFLTSNPRTTNDATSLQLKREEKSKKTSAKSDDMENGETSKNKTATICEDLNEVFPIPRIGTQSIKNLKGQLVSTNQSMNHHPNSSRPPVNIVKRASSNISRRNGVIESNSSEQRGVHNNVKVRSFDKSTFTGEILERSFASKNSFIQSKKDHGPNLATATPHKKLSKFARQRIEMKQQHNS